MMALRSTLWRCALAFGVAGCGAAAVAPCIGTFAGGATTTAAADSTFVNPGGVAVSPQGFLFSTNFGCTVVAVGLDGSYGTVAGNGTCGYNGDGQATTSQLNLPRGVTFDAAGNVVLADYGNHLIRIVWASNSTLTTVVGSIAGGGSFCGDGGPATAACLFNPNTVAVYGGNLFLSDTHNNRVRMVAGTTGIITTVAGSGQGVFCGAGLLATATCLGLPSGLAFDSAGGMFVADFINNLVWHMGASGGNMTIVAGTPLAAQPFCGDGGPATAACLATPLGLTLDSAGNLLVADCGNNRVRAIWAVSGNIATVAGNGYPSSCGNGGPAAAACLQVIDVAAGPRDNVYLADSINNHVLLLHNSSGVLQVVAGGVSRNNALRMDSVINFPTRVMVDTSTDDVYITDSDNGAIRVVLAATSEVRLIVGGGSAPFCGDGGPATAACLNTPGGMAMGIRGTMYIADSGNNRVRVVWLANGTIATAAGCGMQGYAGDGGPATAAQLNWPRAVVVDTNGNVYVADTNNNAVRVMWAATGIITTVAGGGPAPFCGDSGPATLACLSSPAGVALDAQGNLYIADFTNNRVRCVNATTQIITTVAGSSSTASNPYCGDGGPATAACLSGPHDVVVTPAGDLYIADFSNSRVRLVAAANGNITTVAGNGMLGYCGDGGAATAACLYLPEGVALDSLGNLYVADAYNNRVRVVTASTTLCPAGYFCTCGIPTPCTNLSTFCPANVAAPLLVAAGYYSYPLGAGQRRSSQRMCPLGAFCSLGVHYWCPPGTYGVATRQLARAACARCPAGRYSSGYGANSSTACAACPPGTFTAGDGSASCDACPAGTVLIGDSAGGGCSQCPPGTAAFPGAADCTPMSAGMAQTTSRAVSSVMTLPTASVGGFSTQQLRDTQYALGMPLVLLAAVPAALLLGSKLWGPCMCCGVPLRRCLRAMDWFGLEHSVPEGSHHVKRSTTLGGAMSLIAIASVVALAVALLAQYVVANALVQQSVLPAPLPILHQYAPLSPAQTSASPFSLAGNAAAASAGLQLQLATMGPTCIEESQVHVAVPANSLTAGAFSHTAWRVGPPDAFGAVHVFTCTACMFTSLSSIKFTLDGACQSLHLAAYAVGVLGAASAASVYVNSRGINATAVTCNTTAIRAVAVALVPTLTVLNDETRQHALRGITVTAAEPRVECADAEYTSAVTLDVSLTAANTYVLILVTPIVSLSQLASSIFALSGVVAAFALGFRVTERCLQPRVARCCAAAARCRVRGAGTGGGSGGESAGGEDMELAVALLAPDGKPESHLISPFRVPSAATLRSRFAAPPASEPAAATGAPVGDSVPPFVVPAPGAGPCDTLVARPAL